MIYDVNLAYNDLADILHLLAGTRGAFDAFSQQMGDERGPTTAALGGSVSERLLVVAHQLADVANAAGMPYPSWPDWAWAPRPGAAAEQMRYRLSLAQGQALELEVTLNLLAVALPGLSQTLEKLPAELPPFRVLGEHAQRLAPVFAQALVAAQVPGAGQKVIPPYPAHSHDFRFSLPELSDMVYVIAWAHGSTAAAGRLYGAELTAASTQLTERLGTLGTLLSAALEAAHVPVTEWPGLAPAEADPTLLTVRMPGKLVAELEYTLFQLTGYFRRLWEALEGEGKDRLYLDCSNACDRLLVRCSLELERLHVPRQNPSEPTPSAADQRQHAHQRSVAYAFAMNLRKGPVKD